MSGHLHMAQSHSSQEPDPGTGITPFWPKNKINPPLEWELWADKFFLTSDLKERCASRTLLQPPNPVIEEPLPQPEVPRNSKTTEKEGQRMLRDDANRKILRHSTQKQGEKAQESHTMCSTMNWRTA